MIIKAEQKFIRMSPSKIRLVADSVRQIKSPMEVVAKLEFVNKRAALPLSKAIKQAIANAKNNFGVSFDDLRIKEMAINEGPVYKRGRPVSRGTFHRIEKKTSHIRIILETKVAKGLKPKEDTKITIEKEATA